MSIIDETGVIVKPFVWVPAEDLWDDCEYTSAPGCQTLVRVTAPARRRPEPEPEYTVVGEWDEERLPAAIPPSTVQHLEDAWAEGHRAVVTLRVALSRDHLAAALDLSTEGNEVRERDMDNWSVQFIREQTEMNVHLASAMELDEGAEAMRELLDPNGPDTSSLPLTEAVYRAIDRAYPEVASTVTLTGTPHGAAIRCARCDWADKGAADVTASRGLDHSEQAHGVTA